MIYRIAFFKVSLACIAMYANADEQILFVSDQNENSGIYRDFQGVYSNMAAREDGFRQVAQALSSHRLY